MTFNNEAVNDILEIIFPLPERFGLFKDEPVNFESIQQLIKSVDLRAKINFGVSKIVITSPNFNNVVIKIPFNGEFCYDGDWEPFHWAPGSDSSDYCLAEYEKYLQLKELGLSCFVAKTLYYKTINNTRVFIQEKVIPEDNVCVFDFLPSFKSKEIADEWQKEGQSVFNAYWTANCLDKYGKSKVEKFLNYCNEVDLDILEDMHSGNYGYRKNGTPAILDYSNFLD